MNGPNIMKYLFTLIVIIALCLEVIWVANILAS